jgi:hypothetical protein
MCHGAKTTEKEKYFAPLWGPPPAQVSESALVPAWLGKSPEMGLG